MARWTTGEKAVAYLVARGRLESIGEADLADAADSALRRAVLRLRTASAGLDAGDVDGAFAAAYDAYRIAAEALLVRQGLRATGGDGSHVTVEDAVSAQFGAEIDAFRKPTFERLRRTRHTVQYFDPSAAPIERADAQWAIEVGRSASSGAAGLLAAGDLERFEA